jgi:hypothetical protein
VRCLRDSVEVELQVVENQTTQAHVVIVANDRALLTDLLVALEAAGARRLKVR